MTGQSKTNVQLYIYVYLEGPNESIEKQFLAIGVEHLHHHHTVKHLLRPFIEAEVEHLQ